jgi:FkbM family methyltransferase
MQRYRNGITAQEIKDLVGDEPLLLEIGCHDGKDTQSFLQEMPRATIVCFDPEKRATKRFRKLIGDDKRVTLHERAIADVDGFREFYASTGIVGRTADWDYSGSLCEPTGHFTRSPEIKFKEPIQVPCARLDTWYTEWMKWVGRPSIIDFIWADVQGSQRLVIAGGHYALSQTNWLYIESHDPPAYAGEPTQEELMDELSEMFQPIAFYAENILFKNRRIVL